MLQPYGTALLDMMPTEWFYLDSNNPTYPIGTDIIYTYINIYIYILYINTYIYIYRERERESELFRI